MRIVSVHIIMKYYELKRHLEVDTATEVCLLALYVLWTFCN